MNSSLCYRRIGGAGLLVCSLFLLEACGGGGGGSDTPSPSSQKFSVGGSVSGLAANTSVTLKNNGSDSITVNANSNFTFATQIASGSTYSVTVDTQPTGENCTVANGSGAINATVTNIAVACTLTPPDPNGTTVLSPTHKPTLVGVVIDSVVANLNYSSATQAGATNSAGQFNYEPGDLITFKVGDIALPRIVGRPVVTVFDIANAQVNSTRFINIARFLQSLDSDGDVSNGISISPKAHQVATGMTLDFDESTTQFATDANPIIAAIHAQNGTTNTQLIDGAAASSNAVNAYTALPRTSPIAGNWTSGTGTTLQVAIFLDDGLYYMLDGNCGGKPSYEFGSYTYNSSTGQITVTVSDDHDGANCGLNSGTYSLGSSGSNLTLAGKSWQYVTPALGELTGVYGDGNFRDPSSVQINALLHSGEYIEMDNCTNGNFLEAGTYTWNSSSKLFSITAAINTATGTQHCTTSQLIPAPLTASVSSNLNSLKINDGNDDNVIDLDSLSPSFIGSNLIGAWSSGFGPGAMVFMSDGRVASVLNCNGANPDFAMRSIGTYAWDSVIKNAAISWTQNSCPALSLSSPLQLIPGGNVLDIFPQNASSSNPAKSVYRVYSADLIGVWDRAAAGSTPELTIGIFQDGFDGWGMITVISDCAITTPSEVATFDFNASTLSLSNVAFDVSGPNVAGCGLPASFGGAITLQGDSLTVPGLGQFTRVQ